MASAMLVAFAAFTPDALHLRGYRATRLSLAFNPSALAAALADDEASGRLWAGASKALLRVGKSGASATHANGLKDLCSAHPYVCVRLTGTASTDSLDQLLGLLDLAASGGEGPTLLTTRKPRKGGLEALFCRSERVSELCSAE